MDTIELVLLVGACISFLLAAVVVASRVNLIGLGLLLWVLVPTINHIQSMT